MLNLRSSLNTKDQVSHPYIPTAKLYVCIFQFLQFYIRRREGKRFWTEYQQASWVTSDFNFQVEVFRAVISTFRGPGFPHF